MSSHNEQSRNFIERFKELPEIRAIAQKFEFQPTMVLVTYGDLDFVTARDYALSDQMCGRVRPQANMFDDIVRWFFEFEEDAILFTLKFGTRLPRRLP